MPGLLYAQIHEYFRRDQKRLLCDSWQAELWQIQPLEYRIRSVASISVVPSV
jgi:hypothetical protein